MRFVEGTGWMMACFRCRDLGRACWWVLDGDMWNPGKGLQTCRACQQEIDNWRRKRRDPDVDRARRKAYYHRTKAARRATKNAYYAANKEHIRLRESIRAIERRTRALEAVSTE